MAAKVLMPNQAMTQAVTFQGDMLLKSHSFGQVSLPKKTNETSRSRQSIIPSSIEPSTSSPSPPQTTTHDYPSHNNNCLSQMWREIQGSNNWQHLINPLHPLLRNEIIRYGEFVTACYKSFDLNPNSKRYLTCKFGRHSFFNEVGLENSGYEITKYVYATADINFRVSNYEAKWIGYIAVSTNDTVIKRLGRRDIVVAFRGTVTNPEWLANFMSSLTPARLNPHESRPDIKVESGFLSLYTTSETDYNCTKIGVLSCREQLLSEISNLLNKYKGDEYDISITLAGHSMGSSLALLLGYDIAELGINKIIVRNNLNRIATSRVIPVTVFSFAGPRVGNSGFKKRCEELGVKVLRIVNVNDPITKLPGVFLNENFSFDSWRCSCYAHVGVELVLDFFNMQNPSCVHDLETYISLLRYGPKRIINYEDHDHELEEGDGVLVVVNRVKELIMRVKIDFYLLKLKNVVWEIMNLIQIYAESQRVEFLLMDENFSEFLNCLAMYIFLWACV